MAEAEACGRKFMKRTKMLRDKQLMADRKAPAAGGHQRLSEEQPALAKLNQTGLSFTSQDSLVLRGLRMWL